MYYEGKHGFPANHCEHVPEPESADSRDDLELRAPLPMKKRAS